MSAGETNERSNRPTRGAARSLSNGAKKATSFSFADDGWRLRPRPRFSSRACRVRDLERVRDLMNESFRHFQRHGELHLDERGPRVRSERSARARAPPPGQG